MAIKGHSLRFKEVCSVLSLTSSLVYLHITLQSLETDCNLNGNDWEEFLRQELIHLKYFQFFFVYNTDHIDNHWSLSSIIKPFKTSFWLNEKHWIVVCDFVLQSSDIVLYTSPLVNYDKKIIIQCNTSSLNDDYHLMAIRKKSCSNDLSIDRVRQIINDIRPFLSFYLGYSCIISFAFKNIS